MNKPEDLDHLRHSCAHLLAAAVIKLWPNAQRAIGPAIETGFYYDFDFGKVKISEADFPKIEKAMRQILKSWHQFERQEVSPSKAKKLFAGNPYKLELIDEFSKQGQSLSLYRSGNYIDLCRGGHVDQPQKALQHFKLLSVAGAYWRGNEKNKMLTRIYGTAFPTQKQLHQHLHLLEEAQKRDHKKLGRQLDLFTFSPLVGPGLPLWTPKGTIIRHLLDGFVWQLRQSRGYQRVEIPHLTKKDLYVTSGHWDKFKHDLFKIKSREGYQSALKPMNCPHHTQIYARKPHSYKQLPQRYANTTMVYRDEQTGELSGLSRVEAITQDDAHVFCRKSQIQQEFLLIWDIVDEFYSAFGFPLSVRLSLHDPKSPQKYLGAPQDWQSAENQLRQLVKDRGVSAAEAFGEAAFYGPKIDFIATDSLNRRWQVATIQLDMNMPKRFSLSCINEQGQKEPIIMIHAAIMGSIERFLSILIEHTAGAFPVWLAPVQVVILPISEKHIQYAKKVSRLLSGIRVEIDDRSESLPKRIREAELQKIPYMLIVGSKEAQSHSVSIRQRGEKDLGSMPLEKFRRRINQETSSQKL